MWWVEGGSQRVGISVCEGVAERDARRALRGCAVETIQLKRVHEGDELSGGGELWGRCGVWSWFQKGWVGMIAWWDMDGWGGRITVVLVLGARATLARVKLRLGCEMW